MTTFKNLTGLTFGRLKVIKFANELYPAKWICKCNCGKIKKISGVSLTNGKTKSCGCFRKEKLKQIKTKHNLSNTKFYNCFLSIKKRCNNKNSISYKRYGKRGIRCLWKSFEEFKTDMYEDYLKHCKKFGKKNTTIERIDNDKNYCKENCKWATYQEQMLNYSRNRIIEFKGIKKPLSAWAKEYNLTYSIVRQRIDKLGWTIEKSLLTKKLKNYDKKRKRTQAI